MNVKRICDSRNPFEDCELSFYTSKECKESQKIRQDLHNQGILKEQGMLELTCREGKEDIPMGPQSIRISGPKTNTSFVFHKCPSELVFCHKNTSVISS